MERTGGEPETHTRPDFTDLYPYDSRLNPNELHVGSQLIPSYFFAL